ncbi:MAG TPA: 3-deoxy-7-phosphoheptulonate synthase class II [Holophagaceae bacterium]|nr:3-deoxy-7-phosphoheptulonate synthase class II [Holophagaceae bacterium]
MSRDLTLPLEPWTPGRWRALPAAQQPPYEDPRALEAALRQLRELPPLVAPEEVDHLRHLIAEAAQGHRFMLQGGDCAERFADCRGDVIADKLRVLLQMSVVITHGARLPVFHVGRIAGQYAKPRSSDLETVAGRELPVYRGDLVNGLDATAEARRADPQRLLQAYFHAATTLNHLRALMEGDLGDLHHPERWELPGLRSAALERTLARVRESLGFVARLGGGPLPVRAGELFTSHEALVLPFEEALTRAAGEGHFNLGAHMLWVGERTRHLGGAHLEYLRGLRNPIGVKLGPSAEPGELRSLLALLDPDREPGRLTLITRLGAGRVDEALPRLVAAVQASGHPVLWSCDPMHGNGLRTPSGIKTRAFGDILSELRQTWRLHRALGSRLGAVHFELTGGPVTECLGGSQGLSEADLARAYETGCDPRLNRSQSLEMAFLIAELLRE